MFIEQSPSCCGLEEICELREHETPEEALTHFCRNFSGYRSDIQELPNFVLFTGVERFVKHERDAKPKREDYGASDWAQGDYETDLREWEQDHQKKYASAFARFLRKNRLGKVATLAEKPNALNHPDHIVKMYLWSPEKKALVAWYQKRVGQEKL